MNLPFTLITTNPVSLLVNWICCFALNHDYVSHMCYVVKINPCYSNYVKMIVILFKLATFEL